MTAARGHVPPLEYRIRWRAGDPHPGSHRSRVAGPGEDFQGVAPLAPGRDLRRVDLRATATDPFDRPWVRVFRQRSRVPVCIAVDVSHSMRFAGRGARLAIVADFIRAVAAACHRRGDLWSVQAYDRAPVPSLGLPWTRGRRGAEALARRYEALAAAPVDDSPPRDAADAGRGAEGLLSLSRQLPPRRALVFVLTDAHWPLGFAADVLQRCALHQRVLVQLDDGAETAPPARWGLVRLADLETGRDRLLWLRPGLGPRLAAERAAHQAALAQLLQRLGVMRLRLEDRYDAARVARQWWGAAA